MRIKIGNCGWRPGVFTVDLIDTNDASVTAYLTEAELMRSENAE